MEYLMLKSCNVRKGEKQTRLEKGDPVKVSDFASRGQFEHLKDKGYVGTEADQKASKVIAAAQQEEDKSFKLKTVEEIVEDNIETAKQRNAEKGKTPAELAGVVVESEIVGIPDSFEAVASDDLLDAGEPDSEVAEVLSGDLAMGVPQEEPVSKLELATKPRPSKKAKKNKTKK